jgi:hypothetical protein
VLTKKVASGFLAKPVTIDLSRYKVIEDDAAEVLSKYSKDLNLNGLITLSEAAASKLGNFKGGKLLLNGLRKLSQTSANSLRKHRKVFTQKDLSILVQKQHQEKLDQALDEIASWGITIPKSVPRILGDRWSYDPDEFEKVGVIAILARMAFEGWTSSDSLPVGSRGFYLDFEGVYDDDSYSRILRGLAFISGQSFRLSDIQDRVDIEGGEVWLRFNLDDKSIKISPRINRDWVCPKTVYKIINLLTPLGAKFFGIDCGQSVAFFCFPTRISKKVIKKIAEERADVHLCT